jgi:hypothetical protein
MTIKATAGREGRESYAKVAKGHPKIIFFFDFFRVLRESFASFAAGTRVQGLVQ